MQCPKCAHDMERVTFNGVEVDRCKLCKGIWFDATEHETLRQMEGAEAIDVGDRRARRDLLLIPDGHGVAELAEDAIAILLAMGMMMVSPMTISNGTSTSTGVRAAHGEDWKACCSTGQPA